MPNNKMVALIANPRSGQGTDRAGVAGAVSAVAGISWVFQPDSLSDLDRDAAEVSRLAPELIVIAGGDGTIHQSLTRLIHEYDSSQLPQVLLLPTGTMNLLSKRLGITYKSVWQTIGRLAAQFAKGETPNTLRLRPLRIGDEYGFLYGAGFPSKFLERYYRHGAGGLRAASHAVLDSLKVGMRSMWHRGDAGFSVPTEIRMKGDHGWVSSPYDRHTGIVAGRLSDLGFGCQVLPQHDVGPDHFKVRASIMSPLGLAACTPSFVLGGPVPWTFEAIGSEMEIVYGEPEVRMIDGDLKNPVETDRISLGPPVEFITGSP